MSFETDKSSIYELHKSFCNKAETNIKQLNSSFSGYCNSFGFNIESQIELNNLKIQITISKHQTTQNGIVIPKDAIDSSATEIRISGLNKNYFLKIGQSNLKRLITSVENKPILPKPYYITFNDKIDRNSLEHIAHFVAQYAIAKLVLFNGSLHIELHYAIDSASIFINDLLKLMNNTV